MSFLFCLLEWMVSVVATLHTDPFFVEYTR